MHTRIATLLGVHASTRHHACCKSLGHAERADEAAHPVAVLQDLHALERRPAARAANPLQQQRRYLVRLRAARGLHERGGNKGEGKQEVGPSAF